jgi:hypothetical protein
VRGWTTAQVNGVCAFDGTAWKSGDRIFQLRGASWSRTKFYCPTCAINRHQAGPDNGKDIDVLPGGVVPFAPLRALAQQTGERFDHAKAAAGDRD